MVTLNGCLPSERLWIVSNRSSKAVLGLGSFCSIEILSNEAPRARPPSFDPLPRQSHLNSDGKIANEGRPQGGEGTHKGCPYLLFSAKKPASSCHRREEFAIAHYDLHSSGRFALGRAPTRGAPTNCLLWALCLEKGTHKGRPYQLSSLGVMPREGHPQGAPLPIGFFGRYA